jgi:PPM family protein phosphatase
MIHTSTSHLLVGAQTHPGMTGKNNEDRFEISSYRISSSNSTPVTFAVVCDGIGGHRSGEIAADLAVNTIIRTVSSSFGDEPLRTMLRAIQLANEAIYSKAQEADDYRGMGATVAMVWMEASHFYTTSIGDSRIYLIRDHSIRQVTTDHTWIQEALENGTITKDQIANHPNAHVIRRYLGAPVVPQADQRLNLRKDDDDAQSLANQGVELKVGDSILICSDGLTDHVQDREIVEAIHAHPNNNQGIVENLVKLACDRGGKDNITIVLLSIPEAKPKNIFQKIVKNLAAG